MLERTTTPSPTEELRLLLRRNRRQEQAGVYSVCSSHPSVIGAAIEQAKADNSLLLIESTCSQVNQEGGYSGQIPKQFAEFISSTALRGGIRSDQIVLGGDHLGPYPWRAEPATAAMDKARRLVHDCVSAGYQKIHLDASMACANDGTLTPETIAERAAILCEAAERAARELPRGSSQPLYVIGTEVPAPGGETSEGEPPNVTSREDAERALQAFHDAFCARHLEDAWERTIGLVVQPGVEFADDHVFAYDRSKAQSLSAALPEHPELVYEAHSTDYQSPSALQQMVADHFAILKVGPGLTFAFREAVFALSAMERELYVGSRAVSRVREALEVAMLKQPSHWRTYYRGDENTLRLSRAFSYSDRCRYYWNQSSIQQEICRLVENLSQVRLPLTLLSQYLPSAHEAICEGSLASDPRGIIRHHIRRVLRKYAHACGLGVSAGEIDRVGT